MLCYSSTGFDFKIFLRDRKVNGPFEKLASGNKEGVTKEFAFQFCLLFSLCCCLLTHMTAGAPSSYEFQRVEGYVVPPSESSNGTTGYAGVSILLVSFLINIP